MLAAFPTTSSTTLPQAPVTAPTVEAPTVTQPTAPAPRSWKPVVITMGLAVALAGLMAGGLALAAGTEQSFRRPRYR